MSFCYSRLFPVVKLSLFSYSSKSLSGIKFSSDNEYFNGGHDF